VGGDGLYDGGLSGWGEAFKQALTRTIASGGKVRFSLQGVNVTEAPAGDSEMWVGRSASWELQQVLANPSYRAATTFYNTESPTAAERTALGL
jgi:hypothetical protein